MENNLKGFVVLKIEKKFNNLNELREIKSSLGEKDEIIDFYYNASQEEWDKEGVKKYKSDIMSYYLMFFVFQIYYILTIIFVLLDELKWIILLVPPVWILAIPLLTLHPRKTKNQYDGFAKKYLMKGNVNNFISSGFEIEI